MKDLYERLELDNQATKPEIKKAYFRLIKTYSPEKDPEMFKQIKEAYDTLYHDDKRKQYDKIYDIPLEYQNELKIVKDLFTHFEYQKAQALLKKLDKKYPNQYHIKFALAESYIKTSNLGKATTLLESLIQTYPNDQELMLLLAMVYEYREYNKKALTLYKKVIHVNPVNPKPWIHYVKFLMNYEPDSVLDAFEEAEKQKESMFEEDYILYLFAIYFLIGTQDTQEITKLMEEQLIYYYNKFTTCYLATTKVEANDYDEILTHILRLSEISFFGNLTTKILPNLESYERKDKKHYETIEKIKMNIKFSIFEEEKRIHDVIKDLIGLVLSNCNCTNCKNDKLMQEYYILVHITEVKKSILYMQEHYKEYYDLNRNFFRDVINPKKYNNLMDQYTLKISKLMKNNPEWFEDTLSDYENDPSLEFDSVSSLFDEDEMYEPLEPFVRQTKKVGRNDPCPCGSGKKYKQCCGK